MTDPVPGFRPGLDPRTAAKAANASLRGRQQKRWRALAAVAVIIGLTATACGQGSSGGKKHQVEDAGTVASGTTTKKVPLTSSPTDDGGSSSSFKNGILTTPDMRVEITDHRVIQPGKKGNEYGDKPIIAFWYKTTNLSRKKLTSMDPFIFEINAYQDNNPNRENELNVGPLPDDRFLDSQDDNIKKGGSVENAASFELDDLTTPVDLVASDDLGFTEIGKIRYQLK